MSDRLRRSDWIVRDTAPAIGRQLVIAYHYSRSTSNTATYLHGLFPAGAFWEMECVGVAWWIPPTKSAALATYPDNWQGVLSLSRLAIAPSAPKNSASYLLGASMRLIDRNRWPCLVTYADEWQGHTGAIYRATNWQYAGMTAPEATYTLHGRMTARKAGPHTRTHEEMIELGCELVGRYRRHKFVHIARQSDLRHN